MSKFRSEQKFRLPEFCNSQTGRSMISSLASFESSQPKLSFEVYREFRHFCLIPQRPFEKCELRSKRSKTLFEKSFLPFKSNHLIPILNKDASLHFFVHPQGVQDLQLQFSSVFLKIPSILRKTLKIVNVECCFLTFDVM